GLVEADIVLATMDSSDRTADEKAEVAELKLSRTMRQLDEAARRAIAEGRVDEAVAYERRAMGSQAREGDGWRYRRLAELLDRQAEWNATGLDWLYRSGTPGTSRMSAQE